MLVSTLLKHFSNKLEKFSYLVKNEKKLTFSTKIRKKIRSLLEMRKFFPFLLENEKQNSFLIKNEKVAACFYGLWYGIMSLPGLCLKFGLE